MTRTRLIAMLAALSLVAVLPMSTSAQEDPTSPEGVDWVLTGYFPTDSPEPLTVPFGVQASLRLDDGMATGSGGCNTFAGSYSADAAALEFSDELTRTLALCDEAVQSVEEAYLAALPQVAGWSISSGQFQLIDDLDGVLLTFEVPTIGLTSSQLAALQATLLDLGAQVDLANERIDNANIPKLRDRIKTLEADNKTLKGQIAAAQRAPKPITKPGSGSYTKPEQVLLEGIPERIASRCSPMRSQLVSGAVAGVTCTPNTNAVSSMQYYLMDGPDAASVFGGAMSSRNVPESNGPNNTCKSGKRSWRALLGGGWQSEGCDREPGNKVFVQFVDNATNCRQLKVGGKQLKSPAFLVQLQGDHNDIARTYQWATKSTPNGQIQSVAQHIPRPKAKLSPSCPT